MRVITKLARIAVLLLTLLLLSGLAAFGSSPASSYGLDFGACDYAHDGLTWFEPDPLASKYYHLAFKRDFHIAIVLFSAKMQSLQYKDAHSRFVLYRVFA